MARPPQAVAGLRDSLYGCPVLEIQGLSIWKQFSIKPNSLTSLTFGFPAAKWRCAVRVIGILRAQRMK